MIKESDIVYETNSHWVLKTRSGYEVYKIGPTCSTRCATIGWKGSKGLSKAIEECTRRDAKLLGQPVTIDYT